MARFAIIEGAAVTNVVVWDGESPCEDLNGAIALDEGSAVGPGYAYANGEFHAPEPLELPDILATF